MCVFAHSLKDSSDNGNASKHNHVVFEKRINMNCTTLPWEKKVTKMLVFYIILKLYIFINLSVD